MHKTIALIKGGFYTYSLTLFYTEQVDEGTVYTGREVTQGLGHSNSGEEQYLVTG